MAWTPVPVPAMTCPFCGGSVPCWCLLDRRNQEDDAMLALAFREEAEATKQSEVRKLVSRLTIVETRAGALARGVDAQGSQATKIEERLKALESKRG